MGSPRVTYDVDLCYRRSPDNLERLATAMGTLTLTLRGAPPELKFRLDAQALGQNYTFEVDGNGRPTQVIALDDLIRIKRHINRPKDREPLLQLEAIKRLREQEGLR